MNLLKKKTDNIGPKTVRLRNLLVVFTIRTTKKNSINHKMAKFVLLELTSHVIEYILKYFLKQLFVFQVN